MCRYDLAFRFFFFFAAFILSTSEGYLRPAFFARRLALAFCDEDSFFDCFPAFLRGLAFRQGAFRVVLAMLFSSAEQRWQGGRRFAFDPGG
jgi:hypothetical protein